jgi:ecdysone 20-monooxygenase
MVESALKEERDTCAVDAVSSVFMSILDAPGLDVREKKAAIIDFIASGMQTVSLLMVNMYLLCLAPLSASS